MPTQEVSRQTLAAQGNSGFTLRVGENPAPAVVFAADELVRYVKVASGALLARETSPELAPNVLVLAQGRLPSEVASVTREAELLTEDGFRVTVEPEATILAGCGPRGTLYAAYFLLELIGFRWPGPGPAGELAPETGDIVLTCGSWTERPSFPRRCVMVDASHVRPDTEPRWRELHTRKELELVDWMAKNRLNAWGGKVRWVEDVHPRVLEAIRQREMVVQGGGHIIPLLLPRELFREHPEYFRMNPAGRRSADGNFCVSSSEARALVAANAIAYARERPDLGMLNLWGDDVVGGSWCQCPACDSLTPQEQYILACNSVAEAFDADGLDVQLECIAYHDTAWPDGRIAPHPALHLNFGPRERSYGQAIDDPASERNAYYRQGLEAWLPHFNRGQVDVFEYWGCPTVYRSMAVPLPRVLAADLRYYRSVGARWVLLLANDAAYCPLFYPLNLAVFARLAWNTDAGVEAALAGYFQAAYGKLADQVAGLAERWEAAMRPVAELGDLWRGTWAPDIYTDADVRKLSASERELSDLVGGYVELHKRAAGRGQQRLAADLYVLRFTASEVGVMAAEAAATRQRAFAEREELRALGTGESAPTEHRELARRAFAAVIPRAEASLRLLLEAPDEFLAPWGQHQHPRTGRGKLEAYLKMLQELAADAT